MSEHEKEPVKTTGPSSTRKMQFIFVQALTLGRVPLILFFLAITMFVHTRENDFWFTMAIGCMILSAVTDLFDGYFARKFKVESTLGAYADPLTDKIFYLSTFPTLVYLACSPRVGVAVTGPDWGGTFHAKLLLVLAILFLMRDQWVSFLRSIGALNNYDARANWSGKARTIISFPVICLVYLYLQAPIGGIWEWFPAYRWPLLVYMAEFASLAINLISIWVYSVHYWPCLKKELRFPD